MQLRQLPGTLPNMRKVYNGGFAMAVAIELAVQILPKFSAILLAELLTTHYV